ncbi:MAG: hypothetical protein L3J12_10265, partial [Spirochaetales bacterium]|nr:hypothetical protein [Spirochaetales bacterium]
MNFGSAILADIDSDSKKDIIIGSAQSKGVNIMAYSGVLEPVFNFLYSEIYNAETRIHFYNKGNIYFSAKSSLYIPPKIVGAYNIEKESISWNYFTGPAPLDIAANRDFTKLTISNTPKHRKGLIEDSKTVSDHSKFRSSIYVLDSSGTVSTQVSIGSEYAAGEFIKDGISSITERLYDLDGDGKDELIVGINRISDFYIGNAVLEIRGLTGEVINKKEFSPNTDLDFSIFHTEKGSNIAVLVKSKGELYILDKDLTTLNRWKPNDNFGSGVLQESGDFNGDGLIEHLITIGNHLFILDSELKVLFSTAFTSTIQKALFTPGTKSEPILIVQSNTIDLFHIGREETGSVSVFTIPPGADIYIDGQKLKTIPVSGILPPFQAGEVSFQAKIAGYSSKEQILNIETGQHYNLELKLENYTEKKEIPTRQRRDLEPVPAPDIPIKTWNKLKILNTYPKDPDDQLAAIGLIDFAGDSSGDLLFRNNSTHTYKIYDLSMNLLSQFQLPTGSYSTNIEIQHLDINNDSKSDLLINKRFNEEINIITAQGKFLYTKNIGQFPDSVIKSTYIHYNNNLYFVINSGYARHPRGMLGINPENNKISFFSPTAAAPTKLLLTPENILLASIHTPTNGSEITYSNGDTARDSEYYIYMTDLDGNHSNKSFNPKLKDNNGTLEYYLADLNMDNQKETYLVANKTNYYTGHSIIARLNMEKGTISEPLFTSGLNDQIYMHSVLKRNYNSVLAIYTRKPRILY